MSKIIRKFVGRFGTTIVIPLPKEYNFKKKDVVEIELQKDGDTIIVRRVLKSSEIEEPTLEMI